MIEYSKVYDGTTGVSEVSKTPAAETAELKPVERGPWMETYCGKAFHPLTPHMEDISLFDIAHALSQICRFNGHCNRFYSVAQHSVLCSVLVEESQLGAEAKRSAAVLMLLHDAAEAYLGDITRPLMLCLSESTRHELKALHAKIDQVIVAKYAAGLSIGRSLLKNIDEVALMTEARDLMMSMGSSWHTAVLPHPKKIHPLSPDAARGAFLERAKELGLKD